MKVTIVGLFFLMAASTTSAMGNALPTDPLPTVASVDLERYLGIWYEIARLPQSFEKDCVGVTATYGLKPNGNISVLNSCHKGTLDGKLTAAKGYGKVVDHRTNAKLKVTFFWPFFGDYWILELGDNYEYAVVGSPDRKSFWILSRTTGFDDKLLNEIVARFSSLGFDLSTLYLTPQR